MQRNSLIVLAVVVATAAGTMVWGRGGATVPTAQISPESPHLVTARPLEGKFEIEVSIPEDVRYLFLRSSAGPQIMVGDAILVPTYPMTDRDASFFRGTLDHMPKAGDKIALNNVGKDLLVSPGITEAELKEAIRKGASIPPRQLPAWVTSPPAGLIPLIQSAAKIGDATKKVDNCTLNLVAVKYDDSVDLLIDGRVARVFLINGRKVGQRSGGPFLAASDEMPSGDPIPGVKYFWMELAKDNQENEILCGTITKFEGVSDKEIRDELLKTYQPFVVHSNDLSALEKTTQKDIAAKLAGLAAGEAAKVLKESQEPEKVIAAGAAIAESNDAAAWGVLREFLASPEKIKPLEPSVRANKSVGNALSSDSHPLLYRMLSAVARGTPERANATYLWLLEQPLYREHDNDLPWRSSVAYDALQYLRKPDEKVLAFCREKLDALGTIMPDHTKQLVTNALAAYSTPESLALYKTAMKWSYSSPDYLLFHRDKPATLKLFIEQYAAISDVGKAGIYLNGLLGDTMQDRPRIPRTLPPWPTGPEAGQIAEVLETLHTTPPKVPLTAEQDQTLRDLIARLQKATATKPQTPQ